MTYQLALGLRRDATKDLLAVRHIRQRSRAGADAGRSIAPPAGADGESWGARLWAAARAARLGRLGSVVYIVANCIHPPPGLTGTLQTEMLGMTVTYRLEGVIAVCVERERENEEGGGAREGRQEGGRDRGRGERLKQRV
jgi:hypothetical protein